MFFEGFEFLCYKYWFLKLVCLLILLEEFLEREGFEFLVVFVMMVFKIVVIDYFVIFF